MESESISNASSPSASNCEDISRKKRRSAKLKQCNLDARREQWLSQSTVKNKVCCKEESKDGDSKPVNGPTSTSQLKPGVEGAQNSASSFPSQGKGKKRERGDQGSELVKREHTNKIDDGDSGYSRRETSLEFEIPKITENGGLKDSEGVEKLVHLMMPETNEKKIDLVSRSMLAGVIAATNNVDCLSCFIQLRGLRVFDEWLQEVHKGKIGDGSGSKDDRSTDDFLLTLLRALDKLPVNLTALQMCNIGKSVNHLRSHKNIEIQKKARSLVDTWKKRVETEMDAKSGSNQTVPLSARPRLLEVSHCGSKHSGSSEVAIKSSVRQPSSLKTGSIKLAQGETATKCASASMGSMKAEASPAGANLKDVQARNVTVVGSSNPQTTSRDEKSSSSSQSHNNSQSCSSDYGKTGEVTVKEDSRSSATGSGSGSVTKILGNSSRHLKSNNCFPGSTGVPRETSSGKISSSHKNLASEKEVQSSLTCEKAVDASIAESNSHKLIVKIPIRGTSPVQSASGGSLEDHSVINSRTSSPVLSETHEQSNCNLKEKNDTCHTNVITDVNSESWQNNDFKDMLMGSNKGDGSPAAVPNEDNCRTGEDAKKTTEVTKTPSSSGNEHKSGKVPEDSFRPMNAVVDGVEYSESNVCMPVGDDAGMNLLASVAAGALIDSPQRNPPLVKHSYTDDVKLKPSSGDEVVQDHNQSVESAAVVHLKQAVGDNSMAKNADSKISSSQEKSGDLNKHLTSSSIIADSCPGNGKLKEIACTTYFPTSSIGEKTTDIGNYKEHLEKEVLSPPAVPSVEVDMKKNITEGSERSSQSPQKSPIVKHPTKEIEKDALPPGFDKDSGLKNVDEVKSDKIVKVDAPSHAGESETADAQKGGEHEEKNLKDCEGNRPLAGSPTLMETEQPMRPRESNSTGEEANDAEEGMSTTTDAPYTGGADTNSKVEFDLNEGFNADEGKFGDPNSSTASGCSVPVQLVNPVPLPVSSMLSSLPASITVAAAAKGPFVPPDDLLRTKGALGWKGSAATSAFRPAEPGKILDMPLVTSNASISDVTSGKQNRPPLDIDLNLHDERVLQDLASRCFANGADSALDRTCTRDLTCGLVGSSPVCSSGGLDLDLNRVDEPADLGNHLTTGYSRRLDDPMHPIKSFSGILNSKVTVHRDFDLNNGPAADEVSTEPSLFSHNARSSNASSQPPVPSLRMNTTEMANFSSWFPTENTYSSMTLQSILPDRDQPFPIVATGGPQRVLGPPIGATPFNTDVYREPVLSSSSAVPFPSTHYQFPVFPFGTPFPLPSTSFSASSTAYVDSSPAGRFCFPPVHAQLLRPAGVVPSHYPRPYVISLPDGSSSSSNGGAENGRQWGWQGLDLNAGPGGPDIDVRDEMTPLALRQLSAGSSHHLAEEQARMYQFPGGILKRKEPEGGWDGYKQSSWQ